MKPINLLKSATLGLVLLASAVMLTHCTKTNENAGSLNRGLTATDSTVFSHFYDSTVVAVADVIPGINDVIHTQGVASIIQNRCATVSCHGGAIAPALKNYNDIKSLVVAGNPEGSELFQLVTTNDFHKAMPPVYAGELTTTEKVIIYNWIKNGAKEKPSLEDFRPAAMQLIVSGCASVNCHNAGTIGGEWARKGWFAVASGDTTGFTVTNLATASKSFYASLNEPKLGQVWGAYKDSSRKFYTDTLANASFRPFKTFTTPWTTASRRGPLSSYDDVVFDILYPKNIRSNTSVVYTSPTGARYYSRSDYLNSGDCFIRRIDSTLIYTNQRTGVDASRSGNMAYDDGNWSPSEIALVKAWYFADPNIPDVWKYGINGQGMFKHYKTGNKILKK